METELTKRGDVETRDKRLCHLMNEQPLNTTFKGVKGHQAEFSC